MCSRKPASVPTIVMFMVVVLCIKWKVTAAFSICAAWW